jgi:hypothetical protein
MANEQSVLKQLYSTSGAFDKERVVHVLKSVLVIQKGAHAVFFKDEVQLNSEEKILAFALVKRLLRSEGLAQQSSSTANEICAQTGIPQGIVDAKLQKLKKDGALVGIADSYEIALEKVAAALDHLEKCVAENQI